MLSFPPGRELELGIKSLDWADRHGVDTATLKELNAILVNSPRNTDLMQWNQERSSHPIPGLWASLVCSLDGLCHVAEHKLKLKFNIERLCKKSI